MTNFDLNHLIDLDALLSEGSVSGAAKRLNLSASAMSRRLAHLRHALGDPLFVLAGRRLVPTERVRALHDRVRALIEDVRGILLPPAVDIAQIARTFTIRANAGCIGAWAATLTSRVLAEAPGITLRFMPLPERSMDALRNGEVDLDLGVLDATAPESTTQALLKTSLVGVVRGEHPLQEQTAVDVRHFVAWPHVNASRRGLAMGPIDDELRKLNTKRHVAVVVPAFQAALAMVMNSDFIATIPEPFVFWSAHAKQLHVFALPVKTPDVNIAISWHPRQHADPIHAWLREHVRKTTETQGPRSNI